MKRMVGAFSLVTSLSEFLVNLNQIERNPIYLGIVFVAMIVGMLWSTRG